MPGMVVLAGAMKLAQRALEALNLALVIDLLALGQFQGFQHFFHLFERMFQFLDDAIDLLNGIGDRRLLVLLMRLGAMAPLGMFGAFRALSVFTALRLLNRLGVFSVFAALGVLLGRLGKRFGRGFAWHFLVRGLSFRGCGGFAGRGQGTAILAAAGMASATASGSASATRGCRIRLLG